METVGLVTVTYMDNYGSHLQSYALQETVRSLGYNTEIITTEGISPKIKKARMKYALSHIGNIKEMKSYIPALKLMLAIKMNKKFKTNHSKRHLRYLEFAKHNYVFSKITNSWEETNELCKKYKAVIVGSDQNWRPANIAGGYYTLQFVPDEINKIAYSTSFGISYIVNSQKKVTTDFLNRINHLSVREKSGQKIVYERTGRKIPVVCDPVFLIDRDKWIQYISPTPIFNEKYIFCYFLGENIKHKKFAKELKRKTGYKIIAIIHGERYSRDNFEFADITPNSIGPFEFLNLIHNAVYVCTDSFHGCAFSIILNKQFYAFYKFKKKYGMTTNDRLDTMLGWAGLRERIFVGNEVVDEIINENIDFKEVNRNVNSKIITSINYLKKALNDDLTDLQI